MRSRMRPTYAKLFEGFSEPKFFSQYYGPKPELYMVVTLTTVSALLPSRR